MVGTAFQVKKVESPVKSMGFTHFTNFSFCATHCNNQAGKSVMLVPYEK
jgi:hypothetical protein